MHLKYCSITGADDEVDIQDLSALAREYPFVEWALLLLPGEEGAPRCPSFGWIEEFKKEFKDRHAAIHLCGRALIDFAGGKTPDALPGFGRVQLNLKFQDAGNEIDLRQLAARVRENPQHEFILQYTPDRKNILPLFKGVTNHSLLFDASAGRGVSPDAWPAPVAGHFCGYAGGIGPDNVKKNLEMIAKVATGETWIDMESGVRTDDRLDLEKVRKVLEAAKAYT